jgi:NitT/TauT family transport system permease protein
MKQALRAPILNTTVPGPLVTETSVRSRAADTFWYAAIILTALYGASIIVRYVATECGWEDVFTVLRLGAYTLLRVAILIALTSIIWVPIGVMIGLRPQLAEKIQPLAQFLAAFPANLLFPFVVIMVVRFDLNPNIWLSFLMILGTQWYILFNVIAGTTAYPTDFLEAADNFQIHGWK